MGNSSSGGSVNAFAQLYGSNKVCVAADKAVVADNTAAFNNTVVVDSNCSAAEVDLSSNIAVSHVGKVSNSCFFADSRILYFNEVADLNAAFNMAVGTDMYPWTYLYAAVYY